MIHDVRKDRGGNVDHFVSGPTGSFAVETKSGANRAAGRNQSDLERRLGEGRSSGNAG